MKKIILTLLLLSTLSTSLFAFHLSKSINMLGGKESDFVKKK